MKIPFLILIILGAFAIDLLLQFFIPSFSFLTPVVLFVLALTSKDRVRDFPILVAGMFLYDPFGGLAFGFLTISFILSLCSIVLLSHWVDINPRSLVSLMITTGIFSGELVCLTFTLYAIR